MPTVISRHSNRLSSHRAGAARAAGAVPVAPVPAGTVQVPRSAPSGADTNEIDRPSQAGTATMPAPVKTSSSHPAGSGRCHSGLPVAASSASAEPGPVTTTTVWVPIRVVSSDSGSYTVAAPVRRPSYARPPRTGAAVRQAMPPRRASIVMICPSDHCVITIGPATVCAVTTPSTWAGQRRYAQYGVDS